MPLEELRRGRVLEPLSLASVSLGGCCAGQSPLLFVVDDVDVIGMTASIPFLSLSFCPPREDKGWS